MSSKFENIFRINRKSLFATLGGFETSGAFFQGILIFEAQCPVRDLEPFSMQDTYKKCQIGDPWDKRKILHNV